MRIVCILMCLSMVSMVSALSITNGDFESQTGTVNADILYWWDYGSPSLDYTQGPFYLGVTAASFTNTKCAYMGKEANTDEDGGNHTYVYQSIGTYDGTPSVAEITLDWGLAPTKTAGEMGVTVMILESDGTFEPNEWDGAAHDIYGFIDEVNGPIKEIGRGAAFRYAGTGVIMHERFQVDLTGATIGRELFLRFNNVAKEGGVIPWVQVDNITMSPAYVVNQSPEDGSIYVATELDSPENDLVFNVVDDSIVAVDVLFSSDANLPSTSKIVERLQVTPGLNTVDLEDLNNNLNWSTEYFWEVLAYEPNSTGLGVSLKYTGLVTSFTTIQEGPLLYGVTPDLQGVWPGDDAVFGLEDYVKADTFQWYKEGVGALSNGSDYAGVDSNTLTILDCQTVDEGIYYCVGTETATGLTAQSLSGGELAIKELKSYYPFESTGSDAEGTYTLDVIGSKNAYLRDGASLDNTDPIGDNGYYLSLVNPRDVTHTQYAEILDDTVAYHREITISCWVKPTILDLDYERYARIFDFGQDAENYFYLTLLERSNTASCHMTEDDPDDQQAEGVGDIGYGTEWIYVVLTIGEEPDEETEEEGDTFYNGKLYINGEFGGEDGLYSPAVVPTPLSYIGKAITTDEGTPYPNFDGFIDELKIYNYVKTAEEIAQEYMDVMTNVESICDMEANDFQDLDFDDNCEVDLPDLTVIAEKWLQNYLIYPN